MVNLVALMVLPLKDLPIVEAMALVSEVQKVVLRILLAWEVSLAPEFP